MFECAPKFRADRIDPIKDIGVVIVLRVIQRLQPLPIVNCLTAGTPL